MTLEIIADSADPRRVSLIGELDLATADDLVDRVGPVAWENSGDFSIDMSQVAFVDSTGIRAIITVSNRIEGGALVLERPSPTVTRILKLVRADSFPNLRIEVGEEA